MIGGRRGDGKKGAERAGRVVVEGVMAGSSVWI